MPHMVLGGVMVNKSRALGLMYPRLTLNCPMYLRMTLELNSGMQRHARLLAGD